MLPIYPKGYMTWPPSSKAHSDDQIDHTHFLVSDISNTYLSNKFWDVELVVDGKHLHAHRIILALSSGYFKKYFYEGQKKPKNLDVIISEAPVTIFEKLLKYFYTGQIQSSVLKGKNASKFVEMSNYFRISNLQSEYRSSSEVVVKEQIDHTHFMVSEISKLYQSNSCSDVVLVVDGERFDAHRSVLASSSEYFRILFFGGHKETYNKDVQINDVPVQVFKILLKYIYTRQINLNDIEGGDIFGLLKISDFFCVSNLKLPLHNYLQRSIAVNYVCSFLTMARLYKFKELELESLKFMDKHALEILRKDDFQILSPGAIQEILNRDTFCADELDIFKAVCRWINKNQNELDSYTKIKVLSAVRYSFISDEEWSEAEESHLVSSDVILDAIQLRNVWPSDKPRFRQQEPNIDIEHQSDRSPFTDVHLIHRCRGFSVPNSAECDTMITLNYPSWINLIDISLQDESGNNRVKSYSYYIEVSPNGYDWARVIDYSNYNCRSHQRLWIHQQIVRYIHIVGTNGTADSIFKAWVVCHDTLGTQNLEIKNGIPVPKIENMVAAIFDRAIVIEGENSRQNCSLLNYLCEENHHYRDDVYTYHRLGSGFIVVHLRQPYIISSLRMLLWGGHDHVYSYTVEVSVDDQEWELIVDKSNEACRSWQLMKFKPTAMALIRITGTSGSGKEFRCIYLDSPTQATLDSNIVNGDNT